MKEPAKIVEWKKRILRPLINFTVLSNEALVQLLLYGDNDLPNDLNRTMLLLTLRFIYKTGRFR